MNTQETKQLVRELNVVTLKADKTGDAPEVDALLMELGNPSKAIPFLAIFPGDGSKPKLLPGLIGENAVHEALREAGPSVSAGSAVAQRPSESGNMN